MAFVKIISVLFSLFCALAVTFLLGFFALTEDAPDYCNVLGYIHTAPPADETVYVRVHGGFEEYAADKHANAQTFYTRAPQAAAAMESANWEANQWLCRLNGKAYGYLAMVFVIAFAIAFLFIFPLAIFVLVVLQSAWDVLRPRDRA